LAHASGVMLNFVRYSGTAAPSHRLLASDGRSSCLGDLVATTTRSRSTVAVVVVGLPARSADALCQAVARPSEVDDRRQTTAEAGRPTCRPAAV
jgi:hypothetical protein